MRADYTVLLDACVLIPMPLADTLLRMAEAPRLYLPRWSQLIMDEVTRNLIDKWKMEPAKARSREEEIRFPEAWVEGFDPLLKVMTNDPKDRHVLAAAVRCHAELIVTYNQRDFPDAAVRPLEIDVQGPSTFLRGIYDLDPGLFVHKLHEQALAIQTPLTRLLNSLAKNVPSFVDYFCEGRGLTLLVSFAGHRNRKEGQSPSCPRSEPTYRLRPGPSARFR
jgi:predicted nucleic acid-binding protein